MDNLTKEKYKRIKQIFIKLNSFIDMNALEKIHYIYFSDYMSLDKFMSLIISIVVSLSLITFLSLTIPFIVRAAKSVKKNNKKTRKTNY